jgi:5'-phosphate synthase pdxT subunit
VRGPDALADGRLDGLVLPGGESTTQLQLLERARMGPALDAFVRSDRPVLATCAGLILAARHVSEPHQPSFGWLDVSVTRNGWGRQVKSFRGTAQGCARWASLTSSMLFIRAPRIVEVGADAEVVLTLPSGEPVAVLSRSRPVAGITGHPELMSDPTIHRRVFG